MPPHSLFNSLQSFDAGTGRAAKFYSLPQLERAGVGPISKLPISIRIVLESVLRNQDGQSITENDVRRLANWNATAEPSIWWLITRYKSTWRAYRWHFART
jgi:aconitate hydratase A / 2-methylisocitrate dehydratase